LAVEHQRTALKNAIDERRWCLRMVEEEVLLLLCAVAAFVGNELFHKDVRVGEHDGAYL
jgi:hypothetical protein